MLSEKLINSWQKLSRSQASALSLIIHKKHTKLSVFMLRIIEMKNLALKWVDLLMVFIMFPASALNHSKLTPFVFIQQLFVCLELLQNMWHASINSLIRTIFWKREKYFSCFLPWKNHISVLVLFIIILVTVFQDHVMYIHNC